MLLPLVRCRSAVFWLPPGTWRRGRSKRARVIKVSDLDLMEQFLGSQAKCALTIGQLGLFFLEGTPLEALVRRFCAGAVHLRAAQRLVL
jgi:hypothetical protein